MILSVLLILESRFVFVLYFLFLNDFFALYKASPAVFADGLAFLSNCSAAGAVRIILYLSPCDLGLGISGGKA